MQLSSSPNSILLHAYPLRNVSRLRGIFLILVQASTMIILCSQVCDSSRTQKFCSAYLQSDVFFLWSQLASLETHHVQHGCIRAFSSSPYVLRSDLRIHKSHTNIHFAEPALLCVCSIREENAGKGGRVRCLANILR